MLFLSFERDFAGIVQFREDAPGETIKRTLEGGSLLGTGPSIVFGSQVEFGQVLFDRVCAFVPWWVDFLSMLKCRDILRARARVAIVVTG